MTKYIIIFTLFLTSLYANFQVSYLDDKVNYQNVNDVLHKEFTLMPSKISFGLRKNIWMKITIENEKNTSYKNYLSLTNIQVMQDVHFFTVVDSKVIKEDISFNKYTNPNVPNRIGNSLLYQNNIPPRSKIAVYIYITAKSNIFVELKSGEFNEVLSNISLNNGLFLFLIGSLVTLGLYYSFLYMFTPNREYLYYTFFTFSVGLFSFYIYGGYANYFDNFLAGSFSNAFIVLIPIFTILFFKSIYKKIDNFIFIIRF